MVKKKLVYVWSLRNAAADQAGQMIDYKGEQRYMKSVLEYLVMQLNNTDLGDLYTLEAVIFDDDLSLTADANKLKDYGINRQQAKKESWLYPERLEVQGRLLDDLLINVPSTYRQWPIGHAERAAGKDRFEQKLQTQFDHLQADVVMLDGLLVILNNLADEANPYFNKIANIHPGITCAESPFQRRGAMATLDALYGAKGQRVTNWQTMATEPAEIKRKTGASFHFIDKGIDSGPVIIDVLNTEITAEDTILELRWNNFHSSLFPAMREGLSVLAQKENK
ncbi:N(5)-hydroxyornithine transformylase PvdF [Colwellia psychrerythraea]|uniref:phosphoribosylglycinamide formyltransferase 1 n=1 Tax=Colwellia psychrerythraea TaxID=28229 RepID=A0A099L5W1_COLPS|nr:N(5)-hydroxyornithine transformylase PvdF [Colwellia psychrerythraea]KGJ97532.1 formyl transferase domain protein [Colwellia psychrerythraea]